jgi:hypothetical protein
MATPRPIPTASLRLEDVPTPNSKWETISTFALTFDLPEAAHYGEKLADLGNASSNSSLAELRAHLYVEQRRWNHFCVNPDEVSIKRLREIVGLIRQKLDATN